MQTGTIEADEGTIIAARATALASATALHCRPSASHWLDQGAVLKVADQFFDWLMSPFAEPADDE